MKAKEKTSCLLIVFVRNPIRGKVKKRLAREIGNDAALKLYQHLLEHTAQVCSSLSVDKKVYYSDFVEPKDLWKNLNFDQKVQRGSHLGERMKMAFSEGFQEGYENIILIGSDLWELDQEILENAISGIRRFQYVIGPARDGGYYLIGMNSLNSCLFEQKDWGTETVLRDTLQDLEKESLILLDERNDIDTLEDLREFPELQHLINKND